MSRGRLLIVVALTVNLIFGMFLLASVSIEPAYATFPGSNGDIVFESNRDGNYEIYTMKSDGSAQTRLTNNPAMDWEPAWSPDGSKIAFTTQEPGLNHIYVINADGTGTTRLTDGMVYDMAPSWSPDGSKITFSRETAAVLSDQIYVMNADGSGQTRLTNNAARDLSPSWSPDGGDIVFSSNRDGNYEIYVMNADGSGQTRLTNNAANDSDPSWSPDGGDIVFSSDRDGNFEIYTMKSDGSAQSRLTNNPAEDWEPAWSPDGSKIVFSSNRDGNYEIYVMNADGSGQTRLTNNAAEDKTPDWQPVPVVRTPDFGISCDPISVTVMQGGSGSSTCTVASLNGFNSPVTLSSSWSGTPPTGVAYTFSAPSVTPPANGAATSTLTFTADVSASTGGPFVFHVTGASGTLVHSTDVPVFVNVNPWSGVGPTVFTLPATDITDTTAFLHGTVNPNGLATTWDFMSPSGTIYCPSPPESLAPDSTPHDVSCRATNLTPSTHYEFAIRATDSAGQTSFGVYLWFDTLAAPGTPDFSIHCDPSTVTVVQGGSISSTCVVTSQNGFNSPVALSGAWVGAGGVPAGVTPELVPSSVTPSAGMTVPSTLTITASAAASTGSFTYRVEGVSTVGAATLSHTSDVAVQINLSGAGGAGFSIAANPNSLSLGAGASGASTITIQSLGSFSSPVSLTATGSGFNFAWGQNPVPAPAPSGQSSTTLTVTVAGAPVGLQTVTITGTSTADPSMTSQTTLTVTVAGGGGGCLIATATYGSELSPEVQFLRGFRDNSILKTNTGSNFMIAFNAWYYSFSPFVADFVRENSLARTVTRLMLYPLMGILRIGASAFYTMPGNFEAGAVVSGLLASSLIGMVYLSPPLAVVSACSRRMRRIAKRIELPVVAVMLGALVAAAFMAVVGAPSIFMILSTATIVLATLAASAVYTSRALLHVLKRAHVSENA